MLDLVQQRRPNVPQSDFLRHKVNQHGSMSNSIEQVPAPEIAESVAARDPGLSPVGRIIEYERIAGRAFLILWVPLLGQNPPD
jgi:hypothetical protein